MTDRGAQQHLLPAPDDDADVLWISDPQLTEIRAGERHSWVAEADTFLFIGFTVTSNTNL